MANYSIKNFLPGPFPLKCHLVGAKSLSASFDSAPSEPSFHQDAPQTLTGAVSANRSLWIPPSLSPFSPKPRDEACGERPWWLWIPRRRPPQEGTGALLRRGHGLHASFTALWDRTKTPAQASEPLEPSAGVAKTQQPQLTGHPRAGN